MERGKLLPKASGLKLDEADLFITEQEVRGYIDIYSISLK